MVNTNGFQFDLTEFRIDFFVCSSSPRSSIPRLDHKRVKITLYVVLVLEVPVVPVLYFQSCSPTSSSSSSPRLHDMRELGKLF